MSYVKVQWLHPRRGYSRQRPWLDRQKASQISRSRVRTKWRNGRAGYSSIFATSAVGGALSDMASVCARGGWAAGTAWRIGLNPVDPGQTPFGRPGCRYPLERRPLTAKTGVRVAAQRKTCDPSAVATLAAIDHAVEELKRAIWSCEAMMVKQWDAARAATDRLVREILPPERK
jgi:hypothetical protein